MNINIPNVSGDIIVTGTASRKSAGVIPQMVEADGKTLYNNGAGYKNGKYLSGLEEHDDASSTHQRLQDI